MTNSIGIAWQAGLNSGWGLLGRNLAIQAALLGWRPAMLSTGDHTADGPFEARLLRAAAERGSRLAGLLGVHEAPILPLPVLHGLADRLDFPGYWGRWRSCPDIAMVFFEHVDIPPENLQRAADLPLIITGSTWNTQVLEGLGLTNVRLCRQGIEPALFHPAPRLGFLDGRFAVFSGGKLEYRKGQDIVVAGFRIFRARHPEAVLITAWHNLWPASLATLARSPHVTGLPQVDADGQLAVTAWLVENGIPAEAVLDVGLQPNARMPRILRECDVAVFPSRCEGGTNLVAMEAMACGLPVVLAANTGQLDLVGADRCWTLDRQLPIAAIAGMPEKDGWGESDPEELADRLELAWRDRAEAARRGAAAAAFMAGWSWRRQVARMLDAVAAVG